MPVYTLYTMDTLTPIVGGEIWENKELYVFGMELTLKKPLKGTVDILGKIQYFIFCFLEPFKLQQSPYSQSKHGCLRPRKKPFPFWVLIGMNINVSQESCRRRKTIAQCSNDCLIVKLLSMLSKKQSWAPLSSFALLRPRVNDAKAKVWHVTRRAWFRGINDTAEFFPTRSNFFLVKFCEILNNFLPNSCFAKFLNYCFAARIEYSCLWYKLS